MEKLDCLIIGAGVVGLAAARALAVAGREVVVAEKEMMFGSGTSARNSGVIHAGIYYPKDSLKARLCVAGKKKLYAYAVERGMPFKNCTKLIVACGERDKEKLQSIIIRAAANGVDDLSMMSAADAIALEPNLFCTAALLSPSTGIIDIHRLMEEFIVDIEAAGGVIAYKNTIDHIAVTDKGFTVRMGDEKLSVKSIINAAGLEAQTIAARVDGFDKTLIPKQYLAKGNYFGVTGPAPFSRLVYPVPVAGGLGAHFTMNMAGESLFGPDVEWLEEGAPLNYRVDASRVESFYQSVQRFWPGVINRELIPAYAGIRPKVAGPGQPDGDFIIQDKLVHGIEGLINLYGIESPGLTASMAIADEIALRL